MNDPVLQIHAFANEHHNDIIELILTIQQEEFGISITRHDQPDLNQIPTFYQAGHGNFWYATVGGEVAGTIALLDIGNQQVALRKMFVKKEFRGHKPGVAIALLYKALRWSKEKNIRTIFLGTTEKFKAAHRFYEKNGFAEIEKDNLPASFPMMKVDTKFYQLHCS